MISENETGILMKWLATVDAKIVMAEGERLMHPDLLTQISATFDLHVICVDVTVEEAANRRLSRAGKWDRFVGASRLQEQADRLEEVRKHVLVRNLDGAACADSVAKEFQAMLLSLGVVFADDSEDTVELVLDSLSAMNFMPALQSAIELDNILHPDSVLQPTYLKNKATLFESWREVTTNDTSEGEAMRAKARRIRNFLKLPSDQRKHLLSRQYFMVLKDSVFTDVMDLESATVKRKAELKEVVEMVDGPTADMKVGVTRIKAKSLTDGLDAWITVSSNEGTHFLKRINNQLPSTDVAQSAEWQRLQYSDREEIIERYRVVKSAWVCSGGSMAQSWLSSNGNKLSNVGNILAGLAAFKADGLKLPEGLAEIVLAEKFNFTRCMKRFKLDWNETKRRISKHARDSKAVCPGGG